MHLSLSQLLLALPALTIGAVIPVNSTDVGGAHVKRVPPNHPCHINAKQRDLWVEYGRSRWRTTFSASGIDPATYCGFWKDGDNLQCGWDPNVDGGWWRIDASFDRGPLGDALYWKQLERSRENWRQAYGCTTG